MHHAALGDALLLTIKTWILNLKHILLNELTGPAEGFRTSTQAPDQCDEAWSTVTWSPSAGEMESMTDD